MLRCFHIKKLVDALELKLEKYNKIELDSEKESYCDIENYMSIGKI